MHSCTALIVIVECFQREVRDTRRHCLPISKLTVLMYVARRLGREWCVVRKAWLKMCSLHIEAETRKKVGKSLLQTAGGKKKTYSVVPNFLVDSKLIFVQQFKLIGLIVNIKDRKIAWLPNCHIYVVKNVELRISWRKHKTKLLG